MGCPACLGLGLLLLVLSPVRAITPGPESPDRLIGGAIRPTLSWRGQRPLAFELSQGPPAAPGRFVAQRGDYALHLSPTEVVLAARRSAAAVRWRFAGANPNPRMEGLGRLPGRMNYFHGQNTNQWQVNVAAYSRVQYHAVYPGVDLVFYGNQDQIECDFVIAPGTNPDCIDLLYDGMERLEVAESGDLLLHTATGILRQHRPVVYQDIAGRRTLVAARYTVRRPPAGANPAGPGGLPLPTVGFALAAFDATRPLVIDPVLSFATYCGGTGADQAYSVAADAAGNVYVTGQTASSNFPNTNAFQENLQGGCDVFLTKFSPSGALLFSTFLGGSGNDRGYHVTVDQAGNVWLAGVTGSTNFPTHNAYQTNFGGGDRDGFLMKLNSEGSAIFFSTYFGGGNSDDVTDVAVDPLGNAWVVGDTLSTNLPVVRPLQAENQGNSDGLVAKFDAQGTLVFGTYLGGSGLYDSVISVAVDAAGYAYVAGYTLSADFPVRNPLQTAIAGGYDAFVAKIDPAGDRLVYSTWLGGSGDDHGRSIAVDDAGNAYVSGDTFSTDFPTRNACQKTNHGRRDVFVAKLNPAGDGLVYSTYFGGKQDELAALAIDTAGNVFLSGITASPDLPLADPLQAQFGGGIWDAFVAKLDATGSRLAFSTFLGGTGSDQGSAVALDRFGNAFVVGSTSSPDFPTKNPFQPENARGTYDAFVVKIAGVAAAIAPSASNPAPKASTPFDAGPVTNIAPAQLAPAKGPAPIQPAMSAPPAAKPEQPPTVAAVEMPAPANNSETAAVLAMLGTNLIVNGNAELDPPPAGGRTGVSITGWKTEGQVAVLAYGTPGGFPSANTRGPNERGRAFFAGGPDSPESTATQTIEVSAAGAIIDAGQALFDLTTWLGGMAGQNDTAAVTLTFRNGTDTSLGHVSLGPVTLTDRNFATKLLERGATGTVPASTRRIEIQLRMHRADGSFNDGYADNLSLVLSAKRPAR